MAQTYNYDFIDGVPHGGTNWGSEKHKCIYSLTCSIVFGYSWNGFGWYEQKVNWLGIARACQANSLLSCGKAVI